MDNENTLKILLSTDNHLGFLEKDEIRGNDSFVTFEEILSIGKKLNPDFVLLGGDIFHENKPSLSSLFKCTELIRKYSLNDNEINFSIVSEQKLNFSHSNNFNFSNFNDKNLNVGMPIFSIHGNHDDPIDKSNLCALDLLHASGLINLFGKNESVEKIEISPILICKGSTKIALYGLGAVRNERLHRLWIQNKVIFLRPTENPEAWFNIFVLHQNRAKHGPSNYLPENLLPPFLDLVMWGHEHDCRLDPEWIPSNELYITQPGSSVATSLSDGEAIDKYIGILKIQGRDFIIDKVKLETVRPFVTESIILQDEPDLDSNDVQIDRQLEKYCRKKIDDLLIMAETKRTKHPNQPLLPLLRIKIDYSGGFELFSTSRLSQQYVERIANPVDMIVLNRKKEYLAREKVDSDHIFVGVKEVGPDTYRVEDIVRQYFHDAGEKMKMLLLNERELAVGVKLFVDKDNNEMVARAVEIQIERTMDSITKRHFTETSIDKEIKKIVDLFKAMNDNDGDDEESMMARLLEEVGSSIQPVGDTAMSDEHEEITETVKSKGAVRGRGRGRGRGSNKITLNNSLIILDDDSMDSNHSSLVDKRKYKVEANIKKYVKRKKI